MAITCQQLISDGAALDAAALATTAGLTRARLTQILNFTLLAPDIQTALLNLSEESELSERELRPLMTTMCWTEQRTAFHRLVHVQ